MWYVLLFHGNNGCTKAPQYYFLYTLRVLLHVTVGCICHCALEGEVFQQSVFLHEAVMTHDKSNRYNGEGQNSNWRLPYASYVRAQRSFDPIPLTLRLLMSYIYIYIYIYGADRLCGLVVSVSGYRYRGPGFDSRRYQIFWVVVGLERGPLSLVRSIEELLE